MFIKRHFPLTMSSHTDHFNVISRVYFTWRNMISSRFHEIGILRTPLRIRHFPRRELSFPMINLIINSLADIILRAAEEILD
jgi:hypothetical protein